MSIDIIMHYHTEDYEHVFGLEIEPKLTNFLPSGTDFVDLGF